jgi:hypothetical protein
VRPGKDACGLEHADNESKQPRRDEADSDRSQRAHRHEGWNAEDDDKTRDSEPAFGGMPRAVILRMQQQLDGVRPAECVRWSERLDNDVERSSGRRRFSDVIANLLQDFASVRCIKPTDGRLEMVT